MLLWRVDYDSEPAYYRIFGHHVGFISCQSTHRALKRLVPWLLNFYFLGLFPPETAFFSYNRDVVPKTHCDGCCELFWRYFYWRWRDWFGDTWTNIVMELLLMDLFSNAPSSHNLLIDPAFPGEKVSKAGPPPPPLPLGPKQCDIVHQAATFETLSHWIMLWVLFGSHI